MTTGRDQSIEGGEAQREPEKGWTGEGGVSGESDILAPTH